MTREGSAFRSQNGFLSLCENKHSFPRYCLCNRLHTCLTLSKIVFLCCSIFFSYSIYQSNAGNAHIPISHRYNSASCSDASLIIVESTPTLSCANVTLNSTCAGGSIYGTSFYGKTLCGGLNLIANGDYGSIAESFSDAGCTNLTSRSFYKQGQCFNLLIASSRFSCSGNKQSGSVSVTGCFGPDCSVLCGTSSVNVGTCTSDPDNSRVYLKYGCGYSAASSAVVSVVVLVIAALAAVML